MYSPPFIDPCPCPLSHFLTEVQKWSRYNILCDRILPPQYVRLYLLQTVHLHRLLQGCYSQLISWRHQVCLCVILQATLWWKPSMSRPMWGVITHISNPKRSIAWTTALKNIPNTRVFTPPCLKILNNISHFVCNFLSFPTTMGHSFSKAVRTSPRYFNYDTEVIGRTYAWKDRSVLVWISYSDIPSCFWSAPLVRWAVLV